MSSDQLPGSANLSRSRLVSARERESSDEIYIDRGLPLPERYPGERLRVMVRDPGTLFVYWDAPEGFDVQGWELRAEDADGQPLGAFRTGPEGSSGYLYLSVALVRCVRLRALAHGGQLGDVILSAPVDPAVTLGHAGDAAPDAHAERWASADLDGNLLEASPVAPGARWSGERHAAPGSRHPQPSSSIHAAPGHDS